MQYDYTNAAVLLMHKISWYQPYLSKNNKKKKIIIKGQNEQML